MKNKIRQSNNTDQDAEFNEWAKTKAFASDEAFTASLSTWRVQQEKIRTLRIKLAAAENDKLRKDAERYEYLISCIEGVHTEPGARGTGIYTWNLQITEPFPVQTEGSLMKSEIDASIDTAMKGN